MFTKEKPFSVHAVLFLTFTFIHHAMQIAHCEAHELKFMLRGINILSVIDCSVLTELINFTLQHHYDATVT